MELDPAVVALHGAYIRDHREWIEVGYLKAARDGAFEPAVLVLLPLDPRARKIADARRDVDHGPYIAEAVRRGATPLITWGVPRAYAAGLLAADFPEAAEVVLGPHATGGAFWVVVVDGRGATPVLMPPIEGDDGPADDDSSDGAAPGPGGGQSGPDGPGGGVA